MRVRAYSIVVCLVLCARLVAAGEAKVIGWRTDGTGLFPDADPPIEWGRTSTSLAKLRTQPGKPKAGDTGKPLDGGVIREWLVLGPVPVPDKNFKKEVIPNEANLEVKEEDSCKNLKWISVSIDNSCVDFKELFGPELVNGKGKPLLAAYAQAWIKSDSEQKIIMNLVTAGKNALAWLNSKPVSGKKPVTLKKGWNCFTFRVISKPCDQGKPWFPSNSWYLRLVFFGPADSTYTEKNIAWSTRMPAQGVGIPIIVGDKLFVTADVSNLLCVDRKSGKVLWVKSNTPYDALPANKRGEFKQAGDLNRQVQELNNKYVSSKNLDNKFCWDKIKLEKKLHRLMKMKPFGSEVGSATQTPVCDGKHIYALFGNCVLACYDLSGKRKWIGYYPHDHYEHGHHPSPILIDDKVVIFLSEAALAFDKITGKLLWKTSLKENEKQALYAAKFCGTPVVLSQKGKNCIFTPAGQLIQATDGKTLRRDRIGRVSNCASPVIHNGSVYLAGKEAMAIKFSDLSGSVKPGIVQLAKINWRKYPAFYTGGHMASPLIHQGLMYSLSIDGLLTVIDIDKRQAVYQKMLDLDQYLSNAGAATRAGIASSPALGGKYIYLFGNQGACLVIKPGRTYEQVAKNRIECIISTNGWTTRQEVTVSCPVFEENRIYVRTEGYLYCIAQ